MSAIFGAIVAGLTGIGFLFWVVAVFFFICGLPGAIIGMFENDIMDRIEDRDLLREMYEDDRMDRYLDKLDEIEDRREHRMFEKEYDTYIDNRQVHFHAHSKETGNKKQKIKD